METEEGDIVLCTVERVEKTIVFVNIEGDGEGSIVTSEIAPGRIRNIRDYVIPKKKIVCKVLRVLPHSVELSLRRVTKKETKEVMDEYKTEKSYESILRTVLKDEAKEVLNKIKEKERLYNFIEGARSNPKELEKLVGKKNSDEILGIINTQKKKSSVLKKEISLKTSEPNGLEKIKELLGGRDAKIKYLAPGRYSVKIEADDIKTADSNFRKMAGEIEKESKDKGVDFQVLEKQRQ